MGEKEILEEILDELRTIKLVIDDISDRDVLLQILEVLKKIERNQP